MLLQGNLQLVFDALYMVGAIDPVLKTDWNDISRQMESQPNLLQSACQVVNKCQDDIGLLVDHLKKMDSLSVQFVAMEVAREFCEYQDRGITH